MSAYVTEDEADTYFETRYPSEEWDDAAEGDRTKVLMTATLLIDQLNFYGDKTDIEQENAFPRNGSTTIPVNVQRACFEIAYALLEGHDTEKDFENLLVTSTRFGQAGLNRDVSELPMNVLHGIPSARAWNYLRPYLNNSQTLRMERIS